MSLLPILGSLAHDGISPHWNSSSIRSGVLATTATAWLGAMLKRGPSSAGGGSFHPNCCWSSLGSTVKVNRPHMVTILSNTVSGDCTRNYSTDFLSAEREPHGFSVENNGKTGVIRAAKLPG